MCVAVYGDTTRSWVLHSALFKVKSLAYLLGHACSWSEVEDWVHVFQSMVATLSSMSVLASAPSTKWLWNNFQFNILKNGAGQEKSECLGKHKKFLPKIHIYMPITMRIKIIHYCDNQTNQRQKYDTNKKTIKSYQYTTFMSSVYEF